MARQSSYTYEELLACGRGELFGPGNAQLPLPPMLMFDRITVDRRGRRRARQGPRPGRARRPAGPLVLPLPLQGRSGDAGLPRPRRALADGRLLPRLARGAGRGRALGVGEVKFSDQVLPTRQAGRLRRRLEARVPLEARARHRRRLAQGGRQRIYEAKDLRVGLFKAERPAAEADGPRTGPFEPRVENDARPALPARARLGETMACL